MLGEYIGNMALSTRDKQNDKDIETTQGLRDTVWTHRGRAQNLMSGPNLVEITLLFKLCEMFGEWAMWLSTRDTQSDRDI